MINIAIIGTGNCASALIQGKYFYSNNVDTIGLIKKKIGKYLVEDIQFVAAFDIDKRKVGQDISKAIYSEPNNTTVFQEVPIQNVKVLKGHPLDGVAEHMDNTFCIDQNQKPVDIANELINSKADILINYLPVGSKNATEFYANEAIKANVAFINAIPEFICSEPKWENKFNKAGLPCAGDDIKSQIGATIIHRILTQLIYDRGCEISNMYQLNIGGNSDFENMISEDRLKSKRISKTNAVLSTIGDNFKKPSVKIGPSEFVPHLKDNKICYINILGKQFGNLPFELNVKLSVEDSPNSAGIMLDVIRLLKIAKDNNLSGNIKEINAFAFKSPSEQIDDNLVQELLLNYVKTNTTL